MPPVKMPRAGVFDGPVYRPGRTPADLAGRALPSEFSRLGSNESPYGPLPRVVHALADNVDSINRYPEVRSATLRRTIADWLGIGDDHVAIGPGSAGLLWQLGQVFLDADSEMVVPSPSFDGYPIVARLMGAGLRKVTLRDHTVDADALVDAITERTAIVVVAEPNNPTGTSLGRCGIELLVDATKGRCLFVIDEAYLEFVEDYDPRWSIELVRRHEHVVVLRTFSKAHGLAGLRVGYAVARPEVIDLIDRVAPPFSVSSMAQVAASASIEALDELDARVREAGDERARMYAAVRPLVDDLPPTDTNFLWIPCGCGPEAERWARFLETHNVITRPVPGHGIRVTVGTADENDRFLDAFRELRRVDDTDGAARRLCTTGSRTHG